MLYLKLFKTLFPSPTKHKDFAYVYVFVVLYIILFLTRECKYLYFKFYVMLTYFYLYSFFFKIFVAVLYILFYFSLEKLKISNMWKIYIILMFEFLKHLKFFSKLFFLSFLLSLPLLFLIVNLGITETTSAPQFHLHTLHRTGPASHRWIALHHWNCTAPLHRNCTPSWCLELHR